MRRPARATTDPKPARQVKVFLTVRSDDVPRAEAASRAKLDKHVASLIAIERNVLMYAGYQCWSMGRKIKPTREDPRARVASPRIVKTCAIIAIPICSSCINR
jgi:hypothetical protein